MKLPMAEAPLQRPRSVLGEQGIVDVCGSLTASDHSQRSPSTKNRNVPRHSGRGRAVIASTSVLWPSTCVLIGHDPEEPA